MIVVSTAGIWLTFAPAYIMEQSFNLATLLYTVAVHLVVVVLVVVMVVVVLVVVVVVVYLNDITATIKRQTK